MNLVGIRQGAVVKMLDGKHAIITGGVIRPSIYVELMLVEGHRVVSETMEIAGLVAGPEDIERATLRMLNSGEFNLSVLGLSKND